LPTKNYTGRRYDKRGDRGSALTTKKKKRPTTQQRKYRKVCSGGHYRGTQRANTCCERTGDVAGKCARTKKGRRERGSTFYNGRTNDDNCREGRRLEKMCLWGGDNFRFARERKRGKRQTGVQHRKGERGGQEDQRGLRGASRRKIRIGHSGKT